MLGDSESDNEPPLVYIERGNHRESFSPEDANAAKVVQTRFSLEEQPVCVFSETKGKSVAFGKLKPGFIYKLKGVKIPNQWTHTQNAVLMSDAVYKKNPTDYLSFSSKQHTIETVCAISQYSEPFEEPTPGRMP